ncbi:MAG: 2Fe-2S iron-sulfur cluster-binding protein [Pseudomonadota bacterium]
MVKVTFVEHNGTEHEVEAEEGLTLMEVAVKNGVPGIDADCGGACACATCHVILENELFEKVDSMSAMEESMLDFASEREDTSRLSCQIGVSAKLEGAKVRVPEFQG